MHPQIDDYGLLYGSEACYCIYWLRASGAVPCYTQKKEKVDYEPVYIAPLNTLECFGTASEREMLENIFDYFNQSPQITNFFPMRYGDIIALKTGDDVPKAYFVDRLGFIDLPGFFDEALGIKEETELTIMLSNIYIKIHECSNGYDYTIYDEHYKELNCGMYDNPDISIWEALKELVTDVRQQPKKYPWLKNAYTEIEEVNCKDFMERVEKAALVTAASNKKER